MMDQDNKVRLELNPELAEKAEYDQMTGCLTLKSFWSLTKTVLDSLDNDRKKDFVFFNIENFKVYNEEFGFDSGNDRICEFALLIVSHFPKRLVARAFGDQFYALVYDDELMLGIDGLNRDFCKKFVEFPSGLKIGIYAVGAELTDPSVACDHARTAGDSIKKQYGALYHVYDSEMDHLISEKRYIIENIDHAIEKGEIVVYYQPVIRTLTNEVCGMEALVRWEDPVKGIIMPNILIETLEDVQMIYKLDSYVIELVCRDYEMARQRNEELVPISVNLSRLDFELCNIFQIVDDTVRRHGVPKNMIHVEITESVFTRDPNFIKKYIREFHEAGYEVWMDDFGSGYSSLNTMKDYDFDVIKIDMLFLRSFNIKAKNIIISIVSMAKRIGIRTLAEGVETPEQMDFLRNAGCEKAQGYLIGRPQPYSITRRDLVNSGYTFEQEQLREYYDNLGLVNLLSNRPLEYDLSRADESDLSSEPMAGGIPIVLFEMVGERLHILQTNRAFRKTMSSIGPFSPRSIEFDMNDRPSDIYRKFRSFLEELREIRGIESFNYIVNGNYCLVRARCTSIIDGRSAYVATIENLSGKREHGDTGKLSEVMPVLCSMFDMITILDPEQNLEEIVYINSYFTLNRDMSVTLTSNLRNFKLHFVHPEDRERFDQTMDFTTLADRVVCSPNGEMDCLFRIRTSEQNYEWKNFTLIAMQKENTTRVLLCIYSAGNVSENPYEEVGIGALKPTVVKNLRDLSKVRRQLELASIRRDAGKKNE